MSVDGKLTVASGNAGTTNNGGDAGVVFDVASVAGQLKVTTGSNNSTRIAGDSKFYASKSLAASDILLERKDATDSAVDLDFYAKDLDVTSQNTQFTAINTKATPIATSLAGITDASTGFGPYLEKVSLGKNKRFTLKNEDGELRVGEIKVDKEGQLAVDDPDNLFLGTLTATDAKLTLVAPTGWDGSDSLIKAQKASFTDGTIVLDGDLSGVANGTTAPLVDAAMTSADYPDDVYVDPYATGLTVLYNIVPEFSMTGIKFVMYGASAHPAMKALSEGQVASQAFVNRGADFVAGEGVSSAVFAAADAGFSFFSAVSYGHERYETGSHVEVGGVSILLGGAYGTDVSAGRLTFGAFFELGDGTYDSYNDFAGFGTVNGSGDTKYVGGGLLGRLDFSGSATGHTYLEASGRVGRVSADFQSPDLPLTHSYSLSATYYGFHVGVGRVFNITDTTTFDLYGKWLFTHQGGKNASIAGNPVHFDDISSHRLRAGFRLSTEVNEWFKPYFGAAYEHELDGKAEASVRGYAIDVPELKGGSGIGEIGVSFAAVERLTVDLSVQGYVGQRQGVSGGLRLTYNFSARLRRHDLDRPGPPPSLTGRAPVKRPRASRGRFTVNPWSAGA
ncbi:MAG: autotransporter outer membrane beta-barrel domain-containing protein [Deltaproteobacteria bacterium]|nr:autotransporter outer membrane beta-barrel domain-containing protein [Deltaproteobacteria bacterium]